MAEFFIKKELKINGLALSKGDFVMNDSSKSTGNFGELRYELLYIKKEDIDNLPKDWERVPKEKIRRHGVNFSQMVELILENDK